jgi:putative transposase
LSPWARRLKDPLWVKYDPRNLARIYVRDPNGRHWPIPYADLRQPPIALWELEAARKRLRESGKSDRTEPVIFAAIMEQRRLVKEAAVDVLNQLCSTEREDVGPTRPGVQVTILVSDLSTWSLRAYTI